MKKYALSLTSAFTSPSLIQSRIVMMYQKNSHHIALSKFLWAIPTLALCLLVASFMQRKTNELPAPKLHEAYTFVTSWTIEAHEDKAINYIFVNNADYLFQFVDIKTKKVIDASTAFKLFTIQRQEIQCQKLSDGLYYAPQTTKPRTIEFRNAGEAGIELRILLKQRVLLPPTLQTYPYLFPMPVPATEKEGGC